MKNLIWLSASLCLLCSSLAAAPNPNVLDAKWTARHEANLLHGVTVLETRARVAPQTKDATALYRRVTAVNADSSVLRLIPYYAWCNRGAGEMTVWLPALLKTAEQP